MTALTQAGPALPHLLPHARPAHTASARLPAGIGPIERVPALAMRLPGIGSRRAAAAQHIRPDRFQRHVTGVAAPAVRAPGTGRARLRIVTQVIDRHAIRYRAIGQRPGDAMSFPALAVKPELPVPIVKTVSSPGPLSAGAADFDSRPESFRCAWQRRQRPPAPMTPVVRLAQAAPVNRASALNARHPSQLPLAHGSNSNRG